MTLSTQIGYSYPLDFLVILYIYIYIYIYTKKKIIFILAPSHVLSALLRFSLGNSVGGFSFDETYVLLDYLLFTTFTYLQYLNIPGKELNVNDITEQIFLQVDIRLVYIYIYITSLTEKKTTKKKNSISAKYLVRKNHFYRTITEITMKCLMSKILFRKKWRIKFLQSFWDKIKLKTMDPVATGIKKLALKGKRYIASNLAKEFMATALIMQSTSNELSTLVSGKV